MLLFTDHRRSERLIVELTKMKLMKVLGALIVLSACLSYFVLRPVCVALTDESLAQFNVPIEQRTDRDFYLRVFQLREGRWHQCKTWLSRQLFF